MNHLTTKYSGTASTVIFTPIWAFAWWPYALLHKINPFITTAILAPAGTNLTKLNVRPRLSLLFAPLTLMYGSVVSYNIAAIFSAAFAAWTAYFLFYYIFKSLWRSLVGGYFFWYSSYINMISNNIINSLTMHVNNKLVLLKSISNPSNQIILRGNTNIALSNNDPAVELNFSVSHTIAPPVGTDNLAIMFKKISICNQIKKILTI